MKISILKSTFAVVVVAASSIGALKAYDSNCQNENQILIENVEALSDIVETVTTWSCDGQSKIKCGAECGLCHTRISSRGILSGTHSCTVIVDKPKPSGQDA